MVASTRSPSAAAANAGAASAEGADVGDEDRHAQAPHGREEAVGLLLLGGDHRHVQVDEVLDDPIADVAEAADDDVAP